MGRARDRRRKHRRWGRVWKFWTWGHGTWCLIMLGLAVSHVADVALGRAPLPGLSWFLAGAWTAIAGAYGLLWWEARRARRQEGAEFQAGTWPCPVCDWSVPVMATRRRSMVTVLDPTDVHAHLLTHEGDKS